MNDDSGKTIQVQFPGQVSAARYAIGQPVLDDVDTTGRYGPCKIRVVDESDNRSIRSLSSALEAVEREHDRYRSETIRLAIAVRPSGLQSAVHANDGSVETGANHRQIRALQKWRLKRVVEYVDNHLSNRISLSDLAAVAGLSPMHFASQFRVATGLRPHEFLLRRRVCWAEELLQNSTMTIVEIALTVGFQTQRYFTTVFKKFVGRTPRQWRTASRLPGPRPVRHDAQANVAAAKPEA
jgi:AraC-like DNA-binding protein